MTMVPAKRMKGKGPHGQKLKSASSKGNSKADSLPKKTIEKQKHLRASKDEDPGHKKPQKVQKVPAPAPSKKVSVEQKLQAAAAAAKAAAKAAAEAANHSQKKAAQKITTKAKLATVVKGFKPVKDAKKLVSTKCVKAVPQADKPKSTKGDDIRYVPLKKDKVAHIFKTPETKKKPSPSPPAPSVSSGTAKKVATLADALQESDDAESASSSEVEGEAEQSAEEPDECSDQEQPEEEAEDDGSDPSSEEDEEGSHEPADLDAEVSECASVDEEEAEEDEESGEGAEAEGHEAGGHEAEGHEAEGHEAEGHEAELKEKPKDQAHALVEVAAGGHKRNSY